jgi:peptidoglycan/xylan/chitin deacetylase (PgdA/CDA1 family)
MYHYVRDSVATAFPSIRALPPALFEAQLDWLEREYRLVTLAEVEAALDGGPLPANAALLTFDDGFTDHHATVLPILQRRRLSGVFFLAHDACGAAPRVLGVHKTQFLLARLGPEAFAREVLDECEPALAATSGAHRTRVSGADRWERADERAIKDLLNYELPFEEADRVLDALFERHIGSDRAFARELYLGEAMVAAMSAAGMTFGYHTRSHRMLSRLTVTEQEEELSDGVAWIRDLTGQRSVPFCYPWGGPKTYTRATLAVLQRAGYSVAFNTVRRRIEIGRDARFELPRLDTRDLPPYTDAAPAAEPTASGEDA